MGVRSNRSSRLQLMRAFVVFSALAVLSACATEDLQADRIAYAKCGPDGAIDWDENPASPPPHCNREGWNGSRYDEGSE